MSKLAKEDVVERERFIFEIFQKDPNSSAAWANQALQDKFGSKMRALRVYELRGLARAGGVIPEAPTAVALAPDGEPPVPSIAPVKRGPGRPPGSGNKQPSHPRAMATAPTWAGHPIATPARTIYADRNPGTAMQQALPMLVKVDGPAAAGAVSETLRELSLAGLTNLAVVDTKERYIIIDIASA